MGSPGSSAILMCLAAMLMGLQFAAAQGTNRKSYSDYTVYRLQPNTELQVAVLRDLESRLHLDLWTPARIGDNADIMVAPDKKADFLRQVQAQGLAVEVLHQDVEAYNSDVDRHQTSQSFGPRFGSESIIDNSRYLKYDEVQDYILRLQTAHPNTVRVHDIGNTFEGRPMRVVQLSRCFSCNYSAIWVDAGIHAREWIAPATALYALSQLAENSTGNHEMLENLDWYFLPVANPDGYEYTFTTDRMWRKTRSGNNSSQCRGADPNRNFEYMWNVVGASKNSCSDIYAGTSPFSEVEMRNIRGFLWNRRLTVKLYLSYHSYGNYLLYPWGFTKQLPNDWNELENLAQKVNDAMVKAGSRPYTIGSSTNTLYAASGGSDDWAKGILGIKLSYTIELPGYNYGFQLPPKYIDAVAKQSFEGLREFAKHVKGRKVVGRVGRVG